jgi:hypothetical protein
MSDSQNAQGRFTLSSVVCYLGAALVIVAMVFLISQAVMVISAVQLFVTSALLAFALASAGIVFANYSGNSYEKPAGICATLAVIMIPVVLASGLWCYGVDLYSQKVAFAIELATVFGGLVALYCFRFPLTTVPVILALWMICMTLLSMVLNQYTFDELSQNYAGFYFWVTAAFGIVLTGVSLFFGRRTKKDYSYWGYTFGALAIWWGLACLDYDNEIWKFGIFVVCVVMVIFSSAINRRAFAILGATGIFNYVLHLDYILFTSALGLAIAAALEGLAVIALVVMYKKHPAVFDRFFSKVLIRRRADRG